MKKRALHLRSQTGSIDKVLLVTVLLLVAFGIVMVFNTSVVEAGRNFGDKYFFGKRQLLWGVIGSVVLVFLSRFPYKFLEKFALPFLGVSIFLLIFTLVPGTGVVAQGASRWIDVGPISFQPAELAKFSLVLYLASVLARKKPFVHFFIPVVFILGLVLLEPDLGTTAVLAGIALIVYFASGAPLWHFLALVPVTLVATLGLILTSEYRKERLLTFINPAVDPLGISYHIRQVLIALGSGGLFGVGLGQSRQKYLFLPEPMTDSIFAIIGEELGFLGASAILVVFTLLILRGLRIADRVSDPFGKIFALGITSWIGIQAFINIAAMVAILPLTGVPLPFLSYGGSSLIVSMAGVGILLNISRDRRDEK